MHPSTRPSCTFQIRCCHEAEVSSKPTMCSGEEMNVGALKMITTWWKDAVGKHSSPYSAEQCEVSFQVISELGGEAMPAKCIHAPD